MSIGLLKDIIDQIPAGARLLGMDVGQKTIGLAVSDHEHRVATPLGTIKRVKFTKDMVEIARRVKDYEIGGFVLGLPLSMDGSEGRQCQSVRNFAQEMERSLSLKGEGLWIALWDERLSTASVEDFVDSFVGIKRSKAKERGITDKLAAQHILQGALEFIRAAQSYSPAS